MSRFVGDGLPDSLVAALGVDQAIARADRAIVICTIDEHGWGHPAMVSSLELVARDARNVRFALHAGSRSTRNLRANGRLTLIVVDAGSLYYIKGDVLERTPSLATAPALAGFNLRVARQMPVGNDHLRLVHELLVD